MNPTLYYISQAAGADPSGPYTEIQVKNMYQSGTITADTVVAEHGAREWTPVHQWTSARSVTRRPLGRRGSLTPMGWLGCVAGCLGTLSTPLSIWLIIPLACWVGAYFVLRRGNEWRPFTGAGLAIGACFAVAVGCGLLAIASWKDDQAERQHALQMQAMRLEFDRDWAQTQKEMREQETKRNQEAVQRVLNP